MVWRWESAGCRNGQHQSEPAARHVATKVTDQSVNISAAVDEFMITLVALLVVMAVCFVSMGWRVGVVVAAAVPLTSPCQVMEATGKTSTASLGSLISPWGCWWMMPSLPRNDGGQMEEGYDRLKASAYAEPYRRAHAGRYR